MEILHPGHGAGPDCRPLRYCEAFIQWLLEDNFCNGRPALADFVKG